MSVAVPVIDSIDPIARLIYLKDGVREYHPVDDIYKEVRNLRRIDETLRPYDVFVQAGGNVKKLADGSKRTPRFAIFNNTKVVPSTDVSHDLEITGEQLFTPSLGAEPTGLGSDAVDKTPLPPGIEVNIDYAPALAEVIVVGGGGGGLSAPQDATLTRILDIAEGDEIHEVDGADPRFKKLHKDTQEVLVDKKRTGGNLPGTITLTEP